MSEESTTSDLVERWRRSFTAFNRGDIDAALNLWGRDPVWDLSPMGLGVYEGLATIRVFWEDWVGAYEEWKAYAAVAVWVDGAIVRITNYGDVDEARAAAERLVKERADG